MTVKLVEHLTPEQEAKFPEFRDKWIQIGESTEPIDKQESYEAVMECYELQGYSRPDFVVFVKSPFQLFYTNPIWNWLVEFFSIVTEDIYSDDYEGPEQINRDLWYSIRLDAIDEWDVIKMEWRRRAIADIFDAIIESTRHKVPDIDFRGDKRAYNRAFALAQQEFIDTLNIQKLIELAGCERRKEVYGQNETWLGFYDFMEWAGSTGLESVHGIQRAAKAQGWWIPYDTMAVVSDRPCELHLDEQGRLHSHESPAIIFRDGWKYYASHNVEIPHWYIEYPERITVEKIDSEDNVEFRRIMLEIYGFDNYLKNSEAELVDRDADPHIGALWVKRQEDDEDIYMLEMRNSTQELDGTWKTYVIRVPPEMRTARQANAWSYGLEPHEYNPILQS